MKIEHTNKNIAYGKYKSNTKKISKILISSPDTKILKYLKKKYKRNTV